MSEDVRLTEREGEALVAVLEDALRVHGRGQFFVWSQGQLGMLLPHKVLVCGSYQRQRRKVVFDVFHSVLLEQPVLETLREGDSPLMREVVRAWIQGGGRAVAIEPDTFGVGAREHARQLCADSQSRSLLLHGVSRPQRLVEIESFFLLTSDSGADNTRRLRLLDMVLPQVHSTWRRVDSVEREVPVVPLRRPNGASSLPQPAVHLVTLRERQILAWIREGKSNPQIGELLSISPLTVKNHVQKILRKLNAANRAQAVAQALSMNLLVSDQALHDAA